jgi:membrane-associated protease RseP (regulator of RpoE activity)
LTVKSKSRTLRAPALYYQLLTALCLLLFGTFAHPGREIEKFLSGGLLSMKMRNLFLVFAIVIFGSASALAQRTPRAPSTPQSPTIATPVPPAEPMTFSFYFDGSNYLGILPEEINRENMSRYGLGAPQGVGISRVSEGSPAEKAGLKKGDVILRFDGEPVMTSRKLFRLIGEAAPEQTVKLTISRGGSEQQVSVTLGQREDASRTLGALTPELRDRIFTPRTPRALGDAPEVFSYGFGSNRRVGITTTMLTKQLADFFGVSTGKGLLITSVSENGPAAKAGLKAGDVITELNGDKVEDSGDFIRGLNRKDEGEVTLTIIRDKSTRTIKVMPEHRPTPAFNFSELMPATIVSIPQFKMDIPEMRLLQSMPKINLPVMPRIEIPVMPKIDLPVMPRRLMTLPRIERLQTVPLIL